MANIIGGGPRKTPRIIARKNATKKEKITGHRNYDMDKLNCDRFEVQSGVLTINPFATFTPKELPGVSNEVESYPCRFCSERVFLTSSGLEKHGKEMHPDDLNLISSDILMISAEWKKREFEKIRSRERQSIDRMRHETRATEMIRASINGENILENDQQADSYEACPICNVLINSAHPKAMESHQRAHKKNDELRMQLLEQYGVEIVHRLTCDSCSLVFTEEQKLRTHISTHHVRVKRYICKFCGNISQSLMELNLHKTDVHNIILNARPYMNEQWNHIPEYIKSRRHSRKRKMEENPIPVDKVEIGKISDGDVPCQIQCPNCPLKLNRPVFLIKHMQRVHSKSTFSCIVETGGLPSFKIDVEENGIYWTCCNMKYLDRHAFIRHRRCHIPGIQNGLPHEIEDGDEDIPSTSQGIEVDDEGSNFEGQLVEGPDGTMQVIIPEGMEINGDVYVMFDNDYQTASTSRENSKTNKVRIVHAHQRNVPEETEEVTEEQVEEIIENQEQCEGGEEEGEEDGREVITLTQEQFDQLQMEIGDDWQNMEIVLVDSDGQMIHADSNNSNNDTGQMNNLIKSNDVEIGAEVDADEINGQPLFD